MKKYSCLRRSSLPSAGGVVGIEAPGRYPRPGFCADGAVVVLGIEAGEVQLVDGSALPEAESAHVVVVP